MEQETKRPGEEYAGWKAPETGAQEDVEQERIDNPELAEVMAEYEAATRANIEEAKKEGGARGSEENIKYLEGAAEMGLEKTREQYEEAMGVADDVIDSVLSNEFGIDFEPSSWRLKSHHRLKSEKYLTFLGQDVLRAIDYRTITRDENGRPVPKTFDVKGQQKMIVGLERRSRPDRVTGESELFSINYKLVDAKPGKVPRTVSYYPESRR